MVVNEGSTPKMAAVLLVSLKTPTRKAERDALTAHEVKQGRARIL